MQKLISFVVVSLLVPGVVSAAANGTGTVDLVGGSGSIVYFGIDPEPTGRAACNSDSGYQYTIDISTDTGKIMYSTLLTAISSGKQIRVVGTGQCLLYPSMEDMSYWVLYP